MAIGAALGPLAELAGPVLGAAKLFGGGGGPAAGGAGADVLASPFNNAWTAQPELTPPPPEMNPAFHDTQAKLQSVFDTPPAPEMNPAFHTTPAYHDMPPKPQRIDLSSMRPRTNNELDARAGLTTDSIIGREVPRGVTPEPFARANVFDTAVQPEMSPQGAAVGPTAGVTDLSRQPPQSVFDDEVPAPALSSAFEPGFDTSAPKNPDTGVFGSLEGPIGNVQDWLEEGETNPLFQIGMALMASGYDGSNPFTGIQSGLGGVGTSRRAQGASDLAQRKGQAEIASAEQQKQLQDALAMIAAMYGGGQPSNAPASQSSKGQAYVVR